MRGAPAAFEFRFNLPGCSPEPTCYYDPPRSSGRKADCTFDSCDDTVRVDADGIYLFSFTDDFIFDDTPLLDALGNYDCDKVAEGEPCVSSVRRLAAAHSR